MTAGRRRHVVHKRRVACSHFASCAAHFCLHEMRRTSAGRQMARKTIQAAGGIVVRDGARPLIAVVQRSKDERWVLPRGKLERDENPAAGARREVGGGNRPSREGARISRRHHLPRARPAEGRAVLAHAGLPAAEPRHHEGHRRGRVATLAAAVRRLSYPLEKLFLHHVGRRMLRRRRRKAGAAQSRAAARDNRTKNAAAAKATPSGGAYFRGRCTSDQENPRRNPAAKHCQNLICAARAQEPIPNAPFTARSREKWNLAR